LVDSILLCTLAPAIPGLKSGAGKAALANTPTAPLPSEVVTRAKSGFGVPTGAWINSVMGKSSDLTNPATESKGLVSRRWSRAVLDCALPTSRQLELRAS
jgi:asparagine synthase (glutamine-hydrolysing)